MSYDQDQDQAQNNKRRKVRGKMEFKSCNLELGKELAKRQGKSFGASCASILLGPHLTDPGGSPEKNEPTAKHKLWDRFTEDNKDNETENRWWKRGHLVNGGWGGPGDDWHNLTPLTALANSNHETVERYIKTYLEKSSQYERSKHGRDDEWLYGIWYFVQCSDTPLAGESCDNKENIDSYAPEFIKVSWRAVKIHKESPSIIPTSVKKFPQEFKRNLLKLKRDFGQVLPPDNTRSDGQLLGKLPENFPRAQSNGVDYDVQIHQIIQKKT